MRLIRDEIHFIPIVNCPECKSARQPLENYSYYDVDNEYHTIWFCPKCSYIPQESEYKAFVNRNEAISIEEFKDQEDICVSL